jgi:putative oxidoreductase
MPADLLLLLARLLVCTVFIVSAVDKFNLVPAEVAAMRALKLPAPLFLMRLTGVCEIIGCLMLGLGIGPRIAAVAFALFTVLVSLLFLRFWTSKPDAPDYPLRRNTFFSNLAMIGGLLYVVVAGPGAYSLT